MAFFDLGEFIFGGEANLQAFDFATRAFAFGLGDPVGAVVPAEPDRATAMRSGHKLL